MKERPIIFSGEMVSAIISGRKTMTRRVVKQSLPIGTRWYGVVEDELCYRIVDSKSVNTLCKCPYGQVSDRLWVRETYNIEINLSNREKAVCYRADEDVPFGWKPSIFMPRWASRITLEITNIKVEQLQDITEKDAKAEGCQQSATHSCREKFAGLWDSINGKKHPWASNPWVWVIEFQKVKP